jgi:hypothetical protein
MLPLPEVVEGLMQQQPLTSQKADKPVEQLPE